MIERVVYVKLKDAFSTEEGRAETAERTLAALADVPGVRALRVGTPADGPSEAAWDLAIGLDFDSLDDIEAYKSHPRHRAYVDEFLKPRMEILKAWNFTRTAR